MPQIHKSTNIKLELSLLRYEKVSHFNKKKKDLKIQHGKFAHCEILSS